MRHKWLILITVAASLVAADQWAKYRVVETLTTRFDGLTTLSERLKALYTAPPLDVGYGVHFLPRPDKRAIVVVPGFFNIRYTENQGAAWGLFSSLPEKFRGLLFHVVSLGAVVLISLYYSRLTGSPVERWVIWGLPVVLGGALGNYVDRLTRGFVVDFLDAHWMNRAAWPSFNVADSCICIGVGLLLVDALVRKEVKAPSPSKA